MRVVIVRILVLSFYYQPDLCAGSFRCTALIKELKKYNNCEIEINTIWISKNKYGFNINLINLENN